jgi:hypothetical protein
VKPFELIGTDDLTEPVQVWPCIDCVDWHTEVYRRGDGLLAIREWHQPDCRHLLALIREDAG